MYPGDVDWVTGEFKLNDEDPLKSSSEKTELEHRVEKLENKKIYGDIAFDFWYDLMMKCGPKTFWELLKGCAIILSFGFTLITLEYFFFYHIFV